MCGKPFSPPWEKSSGPEWRKPRVFEDAGLFKFPVPSLPDPDPVFQGEELLFTGAGDGNAEGHLGYQPPLGGDVPFLPDIIFHHWSVMLERGTESL